MRYLTIIDYSDIRAPGPDYRAQTVIYAGTQAQANAVSAVFANIHNALGGGDSVNGEQALDDTIYVRVVRTDDDTIGIGDEVVPVGGTVAKSDTQF